MRAIPYTPAALGVASRLEDRFGLPQLAAKHQTCKKRLQEYILAWCYSDKVAFSGMM